MRDLVLFVQIKKREKHPWRSVTFSKTESLQLNTKCNTPPWVFFTFLKIYKWYQIAQRIIFTQLLRTVVSMTFSVRLNLNTTRKWLWQTMVIIRPYGHKQMFCTANGSSNTSKLDALLRLLVVLDWRLTIFSNRRDIGIFEQEINISIIKITVI